MLEMQRKTPLQLYKFTRVSDIAILSKYYKKKLWCENCVEIPEELAAKCIIHNNSVKGNEKVDTFQSELGRKLDVIKSMETAQNTLRELIDDKDEMIRNQKQIIEGIQNDIDTDTDNTRLKLEEAREIITGKDKVLDKYKEEMAILSVSLSAVVFFMDFILEEKCTWFGIKI